MCINIGIFLYVCGYYSQDFGLTGYWEYASFTVCEYGFSFMFQELAAQEFPFVAYHDKGIGIGVYGTVYYQQRALRQPKGFHSAGFEASEIGCRGVVYQQPVKVDAFFFIALRRTREPGRF
jgi:hypothetical protein